jgi:hypothetical protein
MLRSQQPDQLPPAHEKLFLQHPTPFLLDVRGWLLPAVAKNVPQAKADLLLRI